MTLLLEPIEISRLAEYLHEKFKSQMSDYISKKNP